MVKDPCEIAGEREIFFGGAANVGKLETTKEEGEEMGIITLDSGEPVPPLVRSLKLAELE